MSRPQWLDQLASIWRERRSLTITEALALVSDAPSINEAMEYFGGIKK